MMTALKTTIQNRHIKKKKRSDMEVGKEDGSKKKRF